MEIILIVILIAGVAWYMKNQTGGSGSDKNGGSGKWSHPDARFCHYYENSGIALYPERSEIVLRGKFDKRVLERTFHFKDVKGWHTNIETPGRVVTGGSLTAGATQALMNSEARLNSGLFIRVRDLDHAEWQIFFKHDHSQRAQLARWCEIMDQIVVSGQGTEHDRAAEMTGDHIQ